MIRCALPERQNLPRSPYASSSCTSTSGSTTQPAPRTAVFPERIPVGSWRILCVCPPKMIVCPALGPPWYRQTTSASWASRSTILPLPSSPHCAPTITVAGTPGSVRRLWLSAMSRYDSFPSPGRRGAAGHPSPRGPARIRARCKRARGLGGADHACQLQPRRRAEETRVIVSIRDASEHQAAETRFRALLESAPDAIMLVDAGGAITLANRRTSELFGYEPGELVGRPVELLVPGRFRDGHVNHRAGY